MRQLSLIRLCEQFDFADESLLSGAVDEAILERVKKGSTKSMSNAQRQ